MPASPSLDPSTQATSTLSMLRDPRFDEAQALINAGRVDDALASYRAIGATQSERHYEDALVLEQRGNLNDALELLKKSLTANPKNIEALVKQAQLSSGAKAEKACRAALELSPGHAGASLRLSQLLAASFKFSDAAHCLLQALAQNGSSFELHFAVAGIYLQQADFVAAEPHFRRCIELEPGNLGAYQGLIDILDRIDRIGDVEALCRSYLTHSQPNTYIVGTMANMLVRQQRWQEAEQLYLQILNSLPGSVPMRQLYAAMLEKCGRTAEALAIHEKNAEMAPGNPDSHLQLADIHHTQGNRAAAAEALAQAARLYSPEGNWGLHMLPNPLASRLIFNQLDTIAERYCTGDRALVDNTGLDLKADYALGEVVELFCMVVGLEHIEFLEHLAYPALLASPGFNELLRERKVVYNIYTTPNDLKDLQGFLAKLDMKGIPYRINVEIFAFSQELYSILCLPIIDQVKRSLALKSVVVSTLPDLIISGSLAQVIKDMKPGETVVCAMPRIDSDIAFPALRADLEKGPLQSRDFVRRCMTDFLHPQTYSALKNDSNCLRYRDTGSYYEARNWAPPPLCFYARPEMLDSMLHAPLCGPTSMASFYTIDHDFVESAYRTGNLRLIPDSDYFFWAELTHAQRHLDFLSGRKTEDYYYPDASKFIYQHAFKWIYRD